MYISFERFEDVQHLGDGRKKNVKSFLLFLIESVIFIPLHRVHKCVRRFEDVENSFDFPLDFDKLLSFSRSKNRINLHSLRSIRLLFVQFLPIPLRNRPALYLKIEISILGANFDKSLLYFDVIPFPVGKIEIST